MRVRYLLILAGVCIVWLLFLKMGTDLSGYVQHRHQQTSLLEPDGAASEGYTVEHTRRFSVRRWGRASAAGAPPGPFAPRGELREGVVSDVSVTHSPQLLLSSRMGDVASSTATPGAGSRPSGDMPAGALTGAPPNRTALNELDDADSADFCAYMHRMAVARARTGRGQPRSLPNDTSASLPPVGSRGWAQAVVTDLLAKSASFAGSGSLPLSLASSLVVTSTSSGFIAMTESWRLGEISLGLREYISPGPLPLPPGSFSPPPHPPGPRLFLWTGLEAADVSNYLIVAEDERSFKYFQAAVPDHVIHLGLEAISDGVAAWGTPQYARLVLRRPQILLTLLSMRGVAGILWTDSDVAWLSSPWSHVFPHMYRCDLQIQSDSACNGVNDDPLLACTERLSDPPPGRCARARVRIRRKIM